MSASNKKSILVLNYEFPPLGGGASPVSYEISKGYADLGYRVEVVTMSFGSLPAYEYKDGMHIHRALSWRTKKQICYPREQLTYIISGFFTVRKIIQQADIDVCHCHFIIPTGLLALIIKRMYGIPYIITAHGSDVLGHNPRFSLLYELLAYPWGIIVKHAKMIISPSLYIKKKIDDVSSAMNVSVIPNGIKAGKFQPGKKQKYILTVSRLVEAKGIQFLLEAMKGVDLKEWRIKIVGDGPYRQHLYTLVKKYNMQDSIDFVGRLDNESNEMKQLYAHASIFCQPSLFENMSVVLLEAMQAGCCIVANDVGGNQEVIGADFVYVNNDVASLKKKLLYYMEHEQALQEAQCMLQKKADVFAWQHIHDAYVNTLFTD